MPIPVRFGAIVWDRKIHTDTLTNTHSQTYKQKIHTNTAHTLHTCIREGLSCSSVGKEYGCNLDPWRQEDALEKEMATHSSILAWRIPWTEEPGRLQSVGSEELDMT